MTSVSDPARARDRIQSQIDSIGRLRGSGPNPFDYDLWNSRTLLKRLERAEAVLADLVRSLS